MITKKTYPELKQKDYRGEKVAVVTKTTTEYRLFGILLYKKVLVTPAMYGYEHWDEFIYKF